MNTSFSDSINFISKQTAGKVFNYIKLKSSFYFSSFSKKYYHSGKPSSLAIELTNHCNLHCPECPAGQNFLQRPKGFMDYELFTKIIDEAASDLIYLTFYFQGESYLHKDLYKMISYASKKNIYTALSTNAQLINYDTVKKTVESGLCRIIISIDGTTQSVYEKYRIGGNLDKVIEASENFIKFKNQINSATPYVVYQFLVTKDNEHQISDFFKLSKNLGVDRAELKTIQINDLSIPNNFLPETSKYSRYFKHENGYISVKKKIRNNCYRSWSSLVITWDGIVVPCCFDKDAGFVLGDVSKNSLSEIFSGANIGSFRKKILQYRKEIKICNNCTE